MSLASSIPRELKAAGITDPLLVDSYIKCRELNAAHGRTYYLATLLLEPAKRPFVWALYGFARYADDLIDNMDNPAPEELREFSDEFLARCAEGAGELDPENDVFLREQPAALAMLDTMRRWHIPRIYIDAFLESMLQDIDITEYPTYADLEKYMYGSAAVIGLQMLPILEPHDPQASVCAQALGEAFQLTNFIRDIGEDLDRGRLYLPLEDLELFSVTREELDRRVLTPAVRNLLEFEVARARKLYELARPGIQMVHPTSQPCLIAAFELYQGILDEVERANFDILNRRVAVGNGRRLRVAGWQWMRAVAARRERGRTGG